MKPEISSITVLFVLAFFIAPSLLFVQASSSIDGGGCIDLSQYATEGSYMDILMNGGSIPDSAPVFFDIPSQFVTPEKGLDYCLQNITIPTSVGNNICDKAQNCWLAVGIYAGDNNDDSSTTDSCSNNKDDDGDTSGCYECTCSGSSMSSGIASTNEILSQGCGLTSDTVWGMTCHDVTNGRYDWIANETKIESNYSHVKISICPSNVASCNICQGGGIHPSFRIGVQWISDLQEQCLEHPFGFGCSGELSTSSIIGIVVGSVLLLGALLTLAYYYLFMATSSKRRRRKSNNNRNNNHVLPQTNYNTTGRGPKGTDSNNNIAILPTNNNKSDDDDDDDGDHHENSVDKLSIKTDEDSN